MDYKIKYIVKFWIVFILLSSQTSYSQIDVDEEWKEKNDLGNRYEGIVDLNANASIGEIELIAFYCYFPC